MFLAHVLALELISGPEPGRETAEWMIIEIRTRAPIYEYMFGRPPLGGAPCRADPPETPSAWSSTAPAMLVATCCMVRFVVATVKVGPDPPLQEVALPGGAPIEADDLGDVAAETNLHPLNEPLDLLVRFGSD